MQAWAGFAGAGAVAYAAYVGGKTYNTWLLQKQTERQLHAAEQVLTAVYKVRSALENVRGNFMPAFELEEAERKLDEAHDDEFTSLDLQERDKLITSQAMLMRISRYNTVWDELPANMALAFAFLDTGVEASLKLLLRQVVIVQSSAETYGKYYERDGNQEDREFILGLRRDLWGAGDEGDRVGASVSKAVADIEAVVRPLLRPNSVKVGALQ